MINWAKNEIEILKNKYPEDEYGNACRDSALRAFIAAYNELEKDGHSGFSHGYTVAILERLLDNKPLSPITDEDFNDPLNVTERGTQRCKRYSALFKNADGTYDDINRVDVHDLLTDTHWHSNTKYLSDFIPPITMPYIPEKWTVHEYQFTYDGENCKLIPGEYNAILVSHITRPDGEDIVVNKFYTETENGMVEVVDHDELCWLLSEGLEQIIKDTEEGNKND